MKPILIILASLMIFSCTKDSSKTKLKSILNQYQPKEQIFKFDSEEIISVIGDKGTKIKLNTEDLVYKNGEKAEFPISITLIELTSKEDLIKANVQTVSNGSWLISGGAYKIQAHSNEKELHLKDESNYMISFPRIADAEMSIFYGERNLDGDMNWKLGDITLNENRYPVVIIRDSAFMRYDQEYMIDMQVDTLIRSSPNGKFSISQLSEKFPQMDSISIVNDTIFGYDFWSEQVPSDSLAIKSIELNNEVWGIQNQVYEAISLNKFGWINVDRFYPNITERIEISFHMDRRVWNNQCFIISKSDNLILNQYFDKTGDLPLDFPVGKSFEIFVFGLEDDKLYGSRKVFRTSKKSRSIELKMKEISLEEIQDYLNLN